MGEKIEGQELMSLSHKVGSKEILLKVMHHTSHQGTVSSCSEILSSTVFKPYSNS